MSELDATETARSDAISGAIRGRSRIDLINTLDAVMAIAEVFQMPEQHAIWEAIEGALDD